MRKPRAAGVLTEAQKRRIGLHLIAGLSPTEIAKLEGVRRQSVVDSLRDRNASAVVTAAMLQFERIADIMLRLNANARPYSRLPSIMREELRRYGIHGEEIAAYLAGKAQGESRRGST